MKTKVQPWVLGGIASLITSVVIAGGYSSIGLVYGPIGVAWVNTQLGLLVTNINLNITAFSTSFNTEMVNSFEQQISALAVATKQEAVSGAQISDAIRESHAQLANAINTIDITEQTAQAVNNYSALTGQGHQPCKVLAKNSSLDQAFGGIRATATAMTRYGQNAPGSYVTSEAGAMKARLDLHRDKFCTQTEADAGLCSLSSLPGGDTNGALLFQSTPRDSIQQDAQNAYIQHVLGAPTETIVKDMGKTPAGDAFLFASNRKSAFLSIPAYSLRMIQAANTESPEYNGKSPNDMLKLRVNEYFGGKEAAKWSGTLARNTSKGLIKEANVMAGMETWMHHQQLKQLERLNANLAALVLLGGEENRSNMPDAVVNKQNATSAIK